MGFGKNAKTLIQIRLPFFLHQLHGFLLLLIPFLLGYIPFIAYKESCNGSRILEFMQLEVFGIALCGILIVKDVMVQPLYQWDAFGRGEEIFRHDIAELVIRNVFNIIVCNVGNLAESVILA